MPNMQRIAICIDGSNSSMSKQSNITYGNIEIVRHYIVQLEKVATSNSGTMAKQWNLM